MEGERRGSMKVPLHVRPALRWLLGILLATVVLPSWAGEFAPSAPDDPARPQRILLIYSDERMLPAGIIVGRALRETFDQFDGALEIHSEYLDRARFSGDDFDKSQSDFLREKYRERPPDVIIAGGTAALLFLLEFRSSLFEGVPIVHCAVASRLLSELNPDEDVVGIPLKAHFASTLDLALQLQPHIRQVAVVGGTSERDRNFLEAFRQAAPRFEPDISFRWLTDLSMEELSDAVAQLPSDTVVLYLGIFEDAKGRSLVPQRALAIFAPSSAVPIYGAYATYLGHGIVGGEMVTFEEIGHQTGRIALRILDGMTPQEAVALESYEPRPMFDWKQVQRWGLEEAAFPPESLFLFQEPSFWELHGKVILLIGSLCLLEAGLIGVLIWQFRRSKKAEAVIRENEERLNLAMESANFGIWVRDLATGKIWATSTWLKLFGFDSKETLTFEQLIERIPAEERDETMRLMAQAEKQCGGYRVEFCLTLPEGEERWIESKGRYFGDANGQAIRAMGVSRDVTAQKSAEESTRDLGGRLIHAQEDARIRLARELHDDLSQRVSLLAVELDMMVGRESGVAPEAFSTRIDGISSCAKAIASDLHRLAHHLHPAKLDQLGLETALRTFCHEVAQAHPVEIDFQACDVPRSIPDDIALCLYRIGQEALQNVVKHSGASKAQLRLSYQVGELRLSIRDDGVGFDSALQDRSGSLGVVGMEERARFAGGRCVIWQPADGGTLVEAWVPMDHNGVNARAGASLVAVEESYA